MIKSRFPAVSGAGHVALLACTLAVIWSVLGLRLWEDQRRALRDAETRTANLARGFEETVSRSIAVLDQALEYARDSYIQDPQNFQTGPWLANKTVLRGISQQMAIIDASGMMATSSVSGAPVFVNLSDREHFRVHVKAADDRLFISKPLYGRASGKLSVQFTRRIVDANGAFAGVVVASLDPLVLGRFRESATVGEGFALLVGHDRIIRAAQPDQGAIGDILTDSLSLATMRMLVEARDGDGTATAQRGDSVVSYREVTGYPLYVAISISREAALASYRENRRISLIAGGVLSSIVLFVGAVTLRQRRRLTRFHRALTMTLENISQGILMVDPQRNMPVVNHRVAELLDLPAELARPGVKFDGLLAWQIRNGEFGEGPDVDARIAAMLANGGIDPDVAFYERTRSDGTVLEVRTTILPDGSAVRTFTDVTERKRIERELANARDAAEEGVRARTEFLAIMSHEIRTPINGIIGAAGLLRDMPMAGEQREYVRVIRDSSDHLSALIQDILDFARLDAGRMELEEIDFDPRALVEGTAAMLRGQAHAKGLWIHTAIDASVPARVAGDPARLRQVLINLIGNGIKFTSDGGVSVGIAAAPSGADTTTLTVEVKDTGIGIDPAHHGKLFHAFSQVDSSISRRFGGTGLGLAICRHLVGLMGGSIAAEIRPEGGSVFRFDINSRLAASTPVAAAAAADTAIRPLNILLAEDNPTNRLVATRMLIRMGHTVRAVVDGGDAAKAAAETDYDLILMDMMMPEVDGLAAARMIRAGTGPRAGVPIVGLTANAMPADREACEAAGMDGFVTKPVTADRLAAAIAAALATRANAPGLAPAAALPSLDVAFLVKLSEEIGRDGVAEVTAAFLEDAPARVEAIQAAMAEGAIHIVRREAHALAGAARNVGLAPLGDAAYALQKSCEGTGPDPAAIDALAVLLKDAVTVIAPWAEEHEVSAWLPARV